MKGIGIKAENLLSTTVYAMPEKRTCPNTLVCSPYGRSSGTESEKGPKNTVYIYTYNTQ